MITFACILSFYTSIQKSEAVVVAAVNPQSSLNQVQRASLIVTGALSTLVGSGGLGLIAYTEGSYIPSWFYVASFGLTIVGIALDEEFGEDSLSQYKTFLNYARMNGYSKKEIKKIESDLRYLNSIEKFSVKVDLTQGKRKSNLHLIEKAFEKEMSFKVSRSFASVLLGMSGF